MGGGYFKDATGERRYVHDDEIPAAVKAGWHPADEISFDAPTGEVRTLSPDQVGSAYSGRVAPAYTATSEDDLRRAQHDANLQNVYGGVGDQLLTGVEGAASAVTLGGSDWLLDAYDAGTAERAEANPHSRLAGEIGGGIAATMLTGPEGLGAVLARTPAGLAGSATRALGARLGGFAGRVAAEAAEGAAYGVGQGLSTLALSNVPLTADAVFSELAKGGMYGAGFGAAGGALGHGLGKVADNLKIGREAAEAAELAETKSAGAVFGLDDAEQSVFRDKFRSGFTEAEQATLYTAKAHAAPFTAKDIVYSARLSRDAIYDAIDFVDPKLITTEMKVVQKAQKEMGEIFAEFNHNLDRAGVLDAGAMKALNAEPEKWAAMAKPLDMYRSAAESIAKKAGMDLTQFAKFDNASGRVAMGSKEATDAFLAGEAHAPIRAFVKSGGKIDPLKMAAVNAGIDEVDAASRAMNEAWGIKKPRALTDGDLDRFLKMPPEKAIAAAQTYSGYLKAMDGFVSKFDDGVAGAKLTSAKQKLQEATSMLQKAPAETGGMSAAQLMAGMLAVNEIPDIDGPADEMLKLYLMGKMMKGGKSVVPKGAGRDKVLAFLHNAARGVGARGGAQLAGKVAGSGLTGVIGRSVGATAGVQAMGFLASKLSGKAGAVAAAVGAHTSRLARASEELARAGSKATRVIAPTATALLSAFSFGDDPPKKGASLQESYTDRMAELAAIAGNPMAAHERLFNNLAPVRAVNAQLADKLEMQAMETAQYLLDEAPKDPGTMHRLGLSRWKPSESDIMKWAGNFRALDPAGVWERAVGGGMTPTEAAAMKAIRPETFAEVQRQIASNLPAIQKNCSYDQRCRLTVLFGVPVDSLASKKVVDFVQQQFADRAGPDSKPVDLNAEAFSQNEPTEAQKL